MTDADKNRLETLSVSVLLEMRRAYLANGASPLKHWDQLQDRVRMASRSTEDVGEWVTAISRRLNLGSPSNSLSSVINDLRQGVQSVCDHPREWIEMVEAEFTYLFALCRKEAERRKNLPPSTEALVSEAIGARS